MDQVPFAFFDHLCDVLSIDGLWPAKELSGYYGEVSQLAYERKVSYVGILKDGTEKPLCLIYECNDRDVDQLKEIETVPKKYVRDVYVHLMDAKDQRMPQKLVRRFPYARFNFIHNSPSINAAWVDYACSLTTLWSVGLQKKLDDDSFKLFQKLITEQRVSQLIMFPEACEGDTMEIPKSLLCQGQFENLHIASYHAPWSGSAVRELLNVWSENSDKLRGKNLVVEEYKEGGVEQVEEFLFERAEALCVASLAQRYMVLQCVLKVCSKEECDFINKEYQHNHFTFLKPSCVYKFEEGEEGNKRRLYVSFECTKKEEIRKPQFPANYQGHDDLSLLRKTSLVHVLFA
uniref:FBA_2 domain-containing protein n=1 Tax=Steinernema glaseri TaxID=37863 RepID=A0A1I8AQI4_9BILA